MMPIQGNLAVVFGWYKKYMLKKRLETGAFFRPNLRKDCMDTLKGKQIMEVLRCLQDSVVKTDYRRKMTNYRIHDILIFFSFMIIG